MLRPYADVPLIQVLSRVVEHDDLAALSEFHDHRACFRLFGGTPLRFVGFLAAVRETPWAISLAFVDATMLDDASDAVTDKFSSIPNGNPVVPVSRRGPDCRLYFGALLRTYFRWEASQENTHPLQCEKYAAHILQRLVLKHFRLSCLEALRQRKNGRFRYGWHISGKAIYLWMPSSLTGIQSRLWLVKHVLDPDPFRPGERYRIQSFVDEAFGIPRRVTLESDEVEDFLTRQSPRDPPTYEEHADGVSSLATAVANEKATNISRLRPSIRNLGASKLRALIHDIFQALVDGCYVQKRLAARYGLDEATFGRFAAGEWEEKPIPDLWANTASVVTCFTPFMETAERAGVLKRVEDTTAVTATTAKGTRHGC